MDIISAKYRPTAGYNRYSFYKMAYGTLNHGDSAIFPLGYGKCIILYKEEYDTNLNGSFKILQIYSQGKMML